AARLSARKEEPIEPQYARTPIRWVIGPVGKRVLFLLRKKRCQTRFARRDGQRRDFFRSCVLTRRCFGVAFHVFAQARAVSQKSSAIPAGPLAPGRIGSLPDLTREAA